MNKIIFFLRRHQAISAVSIAVVGNFVWAILQAVLNKVNFFEAVLDTPTMILSFVWGLLSANIPVWSVILVIGIAIFGPWMYSRWSASAPSDNPIKDYNNDVYKNQKYRWHWESNQMKELTPICNKCSGNLVCDELDRYSAWLLCPNCDTRYPNIDRTTLVHAETYFVNKANRKIREEKASH